MALLTNGIVKIPMQFFILFIGAMVFVFFQFITPPLFFNPVQTDIVKNSVYASEYEGLEKKYSELKDEKQLYIREMLAEIDNENEPGINSAEEKINKISEEEKVVRNEAVSLIKKTNPGADENDTNYIFLSFVINFLPVGLIGLVLASIISASMSSTSAELNALASTTVIDIYKRLIKKDAADSHYLKVSKLATVFWGVYAIIFALFANQLGTLIEAVNILGSLVYGTILGIFLVAFYLKKIQGTPTFIAALVAEFVVIYCFIFTEIPFLWFNLIGCLLVIVLSFLFNNFFRKEINPS
jgi:Na+(H+)/acetate symporter ActP